MRSGTRLTTTSSFPERIEIPVISLVLQPRLSDHTFITTTFSQPEGGRINGVPLLWNGKYVHLNTRRSTEIKLSRELLVCDAKAISITGDLTKLWVAKEKVSYLKLVQSKCIIGKAP